MAQGGDRLGAVRSVVHRLRIGRSVVHRLFAGTTATAQAPLRSATGAGHGPCAAPCQASERRSLTAFRGFHGVPWAFGPRLSTPDEAARAQTTRESGVTSGMSQTKANAQMMASTAAKLDEVNDSLQSMLKGLMSELEALQSGWVGHGGKAFWLVKQDWAEKQEKMSHALAETAGKIRTSGTSYDTTDTEASSRMAATNRGIQLPL